MSEAGNPYQELFTLLSEDHGIIATQDELEQIIHASCDIRKWQEDEEIATLRRELEDMTGEKDHWYYSCFESMKKAQELKYELSHSKL